jgi:plastocyanin
MLDKCDPVTFNAALGDGACAKHRGGKTTFDEAIADFIATGQIDGWEFSKHKVEIKAGGRVTAPNRGGEFHTFTEVAAFGGGCVPDLNAGKVPVPECAGAPDIFVTTGAAPGQSVQTGPLAAGVHKFMCLIHPWMRTVVKAEGHETDDD